MGHTITCTRSGKHTYGTRETAIREAERASLASGRPFRAYQCEFCHFFHLTSQPWKPSKRHQQPSIERIIP